MTVTNIVEGLSNFHLRLGVSVPLFLDGYNVDPIAHIVGQTVWLCQQLLLDVLDTINVVFSLSAPWSGCSDDLL